MTLTSFSELRLKLLFSAIIVIHVLNQSVLYLTMTCHRFQMSTYKRKKQCSLMYFVAPTLPSSTTGICDVCLSSLLTVPVHSELDAALSIFFSHSIQWRNQSKPHLFELRLGKHSFSYRLHSNFKWVTRLWSLNLVFACFCYLVLFLSYHSFSFRVFSAASQAL